MPNGFHGPKKEWDRLEAPYVRIDPILSAFAQRHGVELYKNYRDADRSIRFNDSLSRAIWVNATDTYGANETYDVSVLAHQDRPERFFKGDHVAHNVPISDLDRVLERAATLVASWTADDLNPPDPRKDLAERRLRVLFGRWRWLWRALGVRIDDK
jgi:hypothetical protein